MHEHWTANLLVVVGTAHRLAALGDAPRFDECLDHPMVEIGRASCRERVSVVV